MSKEVCECDSKCSKKCCAGCICATVIISAITSLIVFKIASCNMSNKVLDKHIQMEMFKNIIEIKNELKAGKMIIPSTKCPMMKTK